MSYFHHFHHLVTTHLYAPTLELWFKFELHVDRRLEPVVQCSKQSWKSFSSHVTVSLPVGNELQSQISKLAAPKCSWVTDTWENLCSLVALGSVLRWMMDPSMDILHHNFKTKPQKHPYVNLIIIFLLPDSQPDGAAALVLSEFKLYFHVGCVPTVYIIRECEWLYSLGVKLPHQTLSKLLTKLPPWLNICC